MSLSLLRYFSAPINSQTAMYVIVPPTPGPHPVIYQLHGLSDDHSIWQRRTTIEMHAERIGAMVVLLEGGQSFYTDKADGTGRWEAHIIESIALVDATYRTRTDRLGRAIGGLSMGGYGALKIGLKHAELFGSIVSHSGAVDVADRFREFLKDPYMAALVGSIFGAGVATAEDIFHLARSAKPLPRIAIDCGVDDFLIEDNRRLHAHFERHHIAHRYQEFPGGHSWEYWQERLQDSFDFHNASFAATRA